MGKRTVCRLEKLAYEVAFKSVVADLLLCPEHCRSPNMSNEGLNAYSYIVSVTNLSNGKFVRDITRQRLDQGLRGIVSDSVRKEFVESYNSSITSCEFSLHPPVFLDCVLDGSFEELEVIATDPGSYPSKDIIPIIAKHSPFLSRLTLDFLSCSDGGTHKDNFIALLKSLGLLVNLTELTMTNVPRSFDTVVTIVGRSCPKLATLKFGPALVSVDLLISIVTPNVEELKNICEEDPEKLLAVEVADEMQNQVCKTLKVLEFENSITNLSGTLSPKLNYAMAFLLRHIPNLEILKLEDSFVCQAINLLRGSPETETDSNTLEAAQKHPIEKLKLKEVVISNIHEQPVIDAVTELCPDVETITLICDKDCDYLTDKPLVLESQTKLQKLTKVNKVEFSGVGSKNFDIVTTLWPKQVTSLNVTGTTKIPLSTLAECCNLTDLRTRIECQFICPSGFDTRKPFLPKLTTIEVGGCLHGIIEGNDVTLEQLLFFKPTLKCIKMECCHLGSDPGSWESVFQRWKVVEVLQIKSAQGLDEKTIKKLLRWMPKLKDLTLPASLRHKKVSRHQLDALSEKWRNKDLKMDFRNAQFGVFCKNQPEFSRWEHSDDEGPSEGRDDDDDDDRYFCGVYDSDSYGDFDSYDDSISHDFNCPNPGYDIWDAYDSWDGYDS